MFPTLSLAIEALEVPLHRDALVALVRLRDRLDAKLTTALGEFEAGGLHEVDGDLSMAAWLRHHTGMDTTGARRCTVRARKLHALPALREAFLTGKMTGGQVDVVLAHVPLEHVELFATHEPELVPNLAPLDTQTLGRVMGAWQRYAEDLTDPGADGETDTVHLSATTAGRAELRGSLGPDLHALLAAALRVADSHDRDLTPAERRADALGVVCRHFLDHQTSRRGGRHRPHVNVTVVDDTATYIDTGQVPTRAELGALLCDCTLHRLTIDHRSAILDYGRSTRTWPVDLSNAIAARDQGCRWPGCDRRPSWADIHHVHWWEHGGHTSTDNGVLLCRRHHRRLHAGTGWHAKLRADAILEITDPDGRVETTTPRLTVDRSLWPPGQRPLAA